MPSRIYRHAHVWRRRLSRSRIASWLLGKDRPALESPGHGLILIQIDGLPRTQLENSIRAGRMPFMRKLSLRGDHEVKDFYPGLPSSTPAVQGEIFFGVRTAVPGFSFYDRQSGVEHRMFSPESARIVARELAKKSEKPLLLEGASYSNIYAGGAACARFCAERLDLPSFFKDVSFVRVLVLLILYLPRFLRIFALAFIELYLAALDFVRGLFARENFFKELKFIPTRVGICVGLRELVEFMIRLDIQEGLPIIHANFLGYDEQAHRRGPDSRFAHWTLRGIDKVVRNVTRAAARSEARDYEIIVYSDHGQERSQPFHHLSGESIEAVVRRFVAKVNASIEFSPQDDAGSRKLHARGRSHLRQGATPRERAHPPEKAVVTAMGPLGHIYLPALEERQELRQSAARLLAREGRVPAVLYLKGINQLICETPEGTLTLPQDASRLLGANHPFKKAVTEDLLALCRHQHAGDLIICGWRPNDAPITFAEENGAHGGIGAEETRGFIVAPKGFLHAGSLRHAIRGEDLYHSAQKFLGRTAKKRAPAFPRSPSASLRVMTYNIHNCVGMDGRLRPERIARVIKAAAPDIAALQEVDVERRRSREEHQAKLLAAYLDMHWHFFSLLESEDHDEKYGLALLSKFPITVVKEAPLTNAHPRKQREARGAIWAKFTSPRGDTFHVINTHFGLSLSERMKQADILLGKEWLRDIPHQEATIVCGDFNSSPRGKVYRKITQSLSDAQRISRPPSNYRTFSSTSPLLRIDHIFINQAVSVSGIARPRTPRAILASDHLPLCADVFCRPPSEAFHQSLGSAQELMRQDAQEFWSAPRRNCVIIADLFEPIPTKVPGKRISRLP